MELVCKGRVDKPKKLNVYRLEVVSMSGDADSYEKSCITFEMDQLDLLEEYLILIDAVNKLGSGYSEQSTLEQTVREAGKDLSFKYPEDAFFDLVGSDATCYERWATLESAKIFFVDKEGSEFYYDAPEYKLSPY